MLLCPWDFLGKSTGVGCHALLQGIFPTQGLNLGLLRISYHLSHQGSIVLLWSQCQFAYKHNKYRHLNLIMAPHSSTFAWKIPWTEEPGRLQSMGLLRVGHDLATSLSLFTFMHWRRKWQPTPVFLPGESQGRWRLVGCRLWGHTESDTTEVT